MRLTSDIFTASPTSIQTDSAHLFWKENPSESLGKSIAEFGQTSPVLVCETETGLSLVAGSARLSVLAEARQPVLARLVEEADDTDKGRLYLADNSHRPLDDAMRLAALEFFAPRMDGATLRRDILPLLEIKPKSKDAKLLFAWLDMDTSWRDLLTSGNAPLAAAGPLAKMDDEDRNAVKPLFTDRSWSRSNGVNVLTWLFEAAQMTETSVDGVMDRAGMTTILNQGLSPKDAIARLSAAARQARYPELSKLQDRFASAAGEITAGTGWRMTQPNNFETGGSELAVQVKDEDQLAQAVKDLEALAASSAWTKVWKLGNQDD